MRLDFRFFRTEKPTGEPDRFVIADNTENYQIEVRRHPAARRYTLRVRETNRNIVLTMPTRGSLRQAKSFTERNVAWIAARLRRLPVAIPFAPGQEIPLRGVPHRIVYRDEARGTVWIEQNSSAAPLLNVAGKPAHAPRRIRDFLKREAKSELTIASRRYAEMLSVSVRSVSVRDTASRWGSCSHSGSLSFSWRLILAPSFVLDYLAAHEIAHRIELNHSKRFWNIVDRIFPDRRRAEAWLRVNGSSLHRYGAG
jgi:predicted metal-dependent hydrolase